MTRDIFGNQFQFVRRIEPRRDEARTIVEFMPQLRYRNSRGLPLNKHGAGPFCEFRIPSNLLLQGVYALTVDGKVTYIGTCENLSERFNARGYGSIQPKNCFQGGQPTNCKVNNLVLQEAKRGRTLELWFLETADGESLEAELIRRIQPVWNTQLKW
jgi:hypothetical protein